MVAPLLALLDVREVDLDRRQPGDLERVTQRPRVVGPGAGVEHEPVGVIAGAVELLDELALEVGLEEPRLEAQRLGELRDLPLELGEREVAVDLGRPPLEHVEVHPVHHGHPVLHRASSSIAARRSPSATRHPVRVRPGSSTSTKPTRPPRRFLSRCTATATASRSTPTSSCVGRPWPASSPATSSRSSGCCESVSAASSPRPTASPCR